MRKLLIGAMGLYRRAAVGALKLRGQTPEGLASERVVSGRAWEEFCDTLKAAGASLHFPGAPRDAASQAEGLRYLTRLTRAGLEAFVEHADPHAPVLHRVVHETIKMGSDNPDNHYLTARIDGRLEYRLEGKRNTVHYLGFGTQIGHYGESGGMPPTGYLEASDLDVDDDGNFSIILSSTSREGNWLPMQPESGTLIVRQTFLDRANETAAELRLTPLGEHPEVHPVTPEQMDEGLRSASTLVAGASLLFAKWARDFQRHSNTLPRFDQATSDGAGGDPNIAYFHSHWALGPDEALVIEAHPPQCEHWNFQLNNYWMESLDYRNFRIHINKHDAHYEENGSIRIIVAHHDPGVPNWVNTAGHESGTMCFRWVRADSHPVPQTKVIRLSELADQAPDS
jgi:hypothetical protein